MQTACAPQPTFKYRRHEPEATLLYKTLAREWETWHGERQADTSRTPLPAFVAAEIDAYFRCGILDHGFTILSCDDCDEKLPVAYSCKRRGVCPSCCAKRMSEIAVHLVDNVLPHVAHRQWVTTRLIKRPPIRPFGLSRFFSCRSSMQPLFFVEILFV